VNRDSSFRFYLTIFFRIIEAREWDKSWRLSCLKVESIMSTFIEELRYFFFFSLLSKIKIVEKNCDMLYCNSET
jgi:hypothetical protein